MKEKRVFYCEAAYIVGIIVLAIGTAFIYGKTLDVVMGLVAMLPLKGIVWQVVLFFSGLLVCSTGIFFDKKFNFKDAFPLREIIK